MRNRLRRSAVEPPNAQALRDYRVHCDRETDIAIPVA